MSSIPLCVTEGGTDFLPTFVSNTRMPLSRCSTFNEESKYMIRKVDHEDTEKKIAYVREHGNHSSPARLRNMVMEVLGLPRPKASAEVAIHCGCYALFTGHTRLVSIYAGILERLGVDFTFLDTEYCCGSALVQSARGEDRMRAREASKEFLRLNMDIARRKGAEKMAYFCSSCARIAKSMVGHETPSHTYLLDVLLDHLGDRRLGVTPVTVGYFEGCHSFIDAFYSGAVLPWKRYRRFLDRIEGLEVIDLPADTCCRGRSREILRRASQMDLSIVLCSCNNCVRNLEKAVEDGMRVMHIVELINEALTRT